MNKIYIAITGGSLLISGTMMLNLVMAGMDWKRINIYGIMHELNLKGIAPTMFFIATTLMILGIILLAYNFFSNFIKKIKTKK